MVANIIISAYRNLRRFRTYTLVNIIGLAVGLASCLVILLVVRYEYRFDRHHEHGNRIFRVISATKSTNGDFVWNPGNSGKVSAQMLEAFPQVEAATRVYHHSVQVRYGEKTLTNQDHLLTDASVLDIFTLPLASGDKNRVFDNPGSILISERLAKTVFAGGNAP